MAEITGADVTARSLQSLGVDTIFYIIGGPITPIAEATEKLGIRMIDVRHEQAASMAAHAYSRLTLKPGVCLTPSGPATANAMPGVMNALADASPVIAIGGSTALYQRGMGGFQEMDQVAMMAPACKLSIQATITSRIGEQLAMLYRRSMEGSKGPVYLDLPADIIARKVDEEKVPLPSESYYESRPQGDPDDIKRAIDLLKGAKKPLVVSGSGVIWSGASKELQAFVDQTRIPFFVTPQGRGVIPEDHDLFFGAARSLAFREADVILVVGTRSNFILSYFRPPRWNPDAKIIMLNIDPDELNHNKRAEVGMVADAKAGLAQLLEAAKTAKLSIGSDSEWIQALRAKHAANEERNDSYWNSDAVPIHPMRLMKEVRDTIDRDAVIIVDGHDTLNFGRQSLPTNEPGHRLNAGTHGTMGIGTPFALGAKAARPDKQVVLVCGDGSFGWLGMNIDSACRNDLPFVAVINNNGNMTARTKGRDRIKGHALGHSDYQKIAEAFGGYGERVEKPEEIRPAIERALSSGKPAIVNVITDEFARSSTYSGFFGEAGEYS